MTYGPPGPTGPWEQEPQQPYQPYGYGQGYGQGFQPTPSTNGLAIASLVVSVVSMLSICLCGFTGLAGAVGAVLGHVARGQIRSRGEAGAGLALSGVIVGWISFAIALALGVLIVVLIATGESFDSPTYY